MVSVPECMRGIDLPEDTDDSEGIEGICASCKTATSYTGLILLGQGQGIERFRLCILCLATKVQAACDTLQTPAARRWLTRV
jgi:hypothetical protein